MIINDVKYNISEKTNSIVVIVKYTLPRRRDLHNNNITARVQYPVLFLSISTACDRGSTTLVVH